VFYRRRFLVAVWVGAFLYTWQGPALGQQNPTTADRVIANYVQAIGGSERIASITTLTEDGENVWRPERIRTTLRSSYSQERLRNF
jgi:hypothetical protein